MFIYKITNNLDGKFYIGQTVKDISYRFRKHLELGERGGGYKLHSAIHKHGRNNFSIELVEECSSLEELNEKEEFWIGELKPDYNLCPGGQFRLSAESIEKMRQSLTGKKQPEELVEKRFQKLRELEKDPNFLKKRGEVISEAKKKTYIINGDEYHGLDEVAAAFQITRGAATARVKRGFTGWESCVIL